MHEINAQSQRTSAEWEVVEMPGLFLAQGIATGTASDASPCWRFANLHLPYDECLDLEVLLEELEPCFHRGVLVWQQLQGQQFASREEALQAACIAMEIVS